MTATTQGTLSFSVRDAGGGDGLRVAWVDPLMAPREGLTEPTVEVSIVDPETGELEVVRRDPLEGAAPSDSGGGDGAIPDTSKKAPWETRAAPALPSDSDEEPVDAVAEEVGGGASLRFSDDETDGGFLVEPSRVPGAGSPQERARPSLAEHARVDETGLRSPGASAPPAKPVATDAALGFDDRTAMIEAPSAADFEAARARSGPRAFPPRPSSAASEFRISEFPIPPSGVVASDHDTSSPELRRDLATPPPEDIPRGTSDEVERLRARCTVLERDLQRRVERLRRMADRIRELEAEVKRLRDRD
jgi:hypothetical protein